MFKTAIRTAALAAVLSGAGLSAALADEAATPSWGSFSGSVALTTDYIFRGQTQNHGDPAIQGSFNYNHPSGVYASVWASNIEFVDGDNAKIETDWTLGFSNTLDKWKYDVGFVYYLYPGSDSTLNYDYYEFYGKLGYDFGFASLTGSVYGSPEFTGKTGGAIYYNAGASVPIPFLPWNATLSGWGGYQTFLDDSKKLSPDYWDWSAGIGFTVEGFGLDFRYFGTDLPKADPWTADTADGQFAFTISRAL